MSEMHAPAADGIPKNPGLPEKDVSIDIFNAGINAILARKGARNAHHGDARPKSEIAKWVKTRLTKASGGVSRIPVRS